MQPTRRRCSSLVVAAAILALLSLLLPGCKQRPTPAAGFVSTPAEADTEKAVPEEVSGTVTRSGGAPVADADVLVMYMTAGPLPPRKPTTRQTRTDPSGNFRLTLTDLMSGSPLNVVATKPGLAVGGDYVRGRTDDIRIVLQEHPVTLRGRVTDEAGRPLAGAMVAAATVIHELSPGNRDIVSLPQEAFPPATTGADGSFSFAGFPAGCKAGLSLKAPGREKTQLEVAVPNPNGVVIALHPGATISGRVLLHGQPAPNVQFECWQKSKGFYGQMDVTSRSDGSYLVDGLVAGHYALRPARPPAEGQLLFRAVSLDLKRSEQRTGVDLEASNAAVIKGRISIPGSSRDLSNFDVIAANAQEARRDPDDIAFAKPERDGSYILRVFPGKITVSPGFDEIEVEPKWRELTVGEGQMVTGADFKLLLPADLTGRVQDAQGQPVRSAKVTSPAYGRGEEPEYATVETNDQGVFVFGDPPAAGPPYLLTAKANGLAGVSSLADAKTPAVITLAPACSVTATVVDEAGKAVPGILLNLTYHAQTIASGRSDSNGIVRFEGVPAPPGVGRDEGLGLEMDRALLDKVIGNPWRFMRLKPGQAATEKFVLNLVGRTVRVRVLTADGKPATFAQACGQGSPQTVSVGSDGWCTLAGLNSRREVWVLAMHPTQQLMAAVLVDPLKTKTATLTLRPMVAAQGRVVDQNGHPVQGTLYTYPGLGRTGGLMNGMPGPVWQRLRKLLPFEGPIGAGGRWTATPLIADCPHHVYARQRNGEWGDVLGYAGTDYRTKAAGTTTVPDLVVKPK